MTTNSNGGPGKTRHLNDIAVCCENLGMRVICVDAAESDFWLSASLPCATALEGRRGFLRAYSYCSGNEGTACSWENRVQV